MKFTEIKIGDILQLPGSSLFTVTEAPVVQEDGVNYKMTGDVSGGEINQTGCEWFGLADSEVDAISS
ncbi:hypothetical protein [Klebsiella spallanzanii]|uniref:hypothetical protein n=1 Tax=Klebsiella spallanzanii TaxID=2587528 RepID=UPI001158DE81|nr:hypothetical protein [Klebsiella spallanzanii]VUS67586.1 hypothetical protein SB6419_04045 [Klebsiella spallanzanii]